MKEAPVAHFLYGGATGALYTLWQPVFPWRQTFSMGVAFGLLVWAGSYLFLLPALGLVESAYTEPWKRNLMMIGAHFVWGVSLAMIEPGVRSFL